MAFGDVVQTKTASGEDSATVVFDATPTEGNRIVVAVRTSAAGGVGATTPTGYDVGPAESASRGGIAMFSKVAGASESASIQCDAASTASVAVTAIELEGPWDAAGDVSASNTSGNTQVSSISTGTTGTTSEADAVAVAAAGSIINLNDITGWSNSFVDRDGIEADLNNNVTLGVATKLLTATGTQESTATFAGNQRSKAAIWVFTKGEVASGPPEASGTVSGEGSLSAVGVGGQIPTPGGLPSAAVIGFYDGRDLTGSVNDQVSSWPDSGPNSENALAQATSSKQPTVTESGFGGVRGVLFDGSDDVLINSLGSTYSGDFAIMVAVELLTYPHSDADTLLSTGGLPDKNLLGVDDNEDPPGWVVMSGDGTQADHHHGTNDQAYLEDTPSRFVMTYLVENDNRVRLWENSVLVIDEAPGSGSGDLNDMGGMTLGAREDESRHTHCRVGALLLVDMAQTDVTGLLAARDDLGAAFNVPGFEVPSASGTVSGEGSVSAEGHVSPAGSGSVTAEGSLAATGLQEPSATGTVAAEGSLSAAGSAPVGAAGSITAEGSLAATGYTLPEASGSTVGQGSLSASGYVSPAASGNVEAEGSLTATGHVDVSAAGTVRGEGSVAAAGQALEAAQAFGQVTGEGSVTATGYKPVAGSGTVTAEASLTAEGHITAEASGTATGEGSLSATGEAVAVVPRASGTVSGEGSVTASGHVVMSASGSVEGVGYLQGVGYLAPYASAVLTAVASINGVGAGDPPLFEPSVVIRGSYIPLSADGASAPLVAAGRSEVQIVKGSL